MDQKLHPIKCRCGIRWGEHARNLAPTFENYKDKIKDSCAWCGKLIEPRFELYLLWGNACQECSAHCPKCKTEWIRHKGINCVKK